CVRSFRLILHPCCQFSERRCFYFVFSFSTASLAVSRACHINLFILHPLSMLQSMPSSHHPGGLWTPNSSYTQPSRDERYLGLFHINVLKDYLSKLFEQDNSKYLLLLLEDTLMNETH